MTIKNKKLKLNKFKIFIIIIVTSILLLTNRKIEAASYIVDSWDDAKEIIARDIYNMETEISIKLKKSNFSNPTYPTKEDLNRAIKSHFYDSKEMVRGSQGFEAISSQNIRYIQNKQNNKFYTTELNHKITYRTTPDEFYKAKEILRKKLNHKIKNDMNDYEKIYQMYKITLKDLTYGTTGRKEDRNKDRNVLYGLNGRPVVCEAYAMHMSILLSESGYDNLIVDGHVKEIGHVWNMVKVNDKWYHMDTTWADANDNNDSNFQLKYFLKSDHHMIEHGHQWAKNLYPKSLSNYEI